MRIARRLDLSTAPVGRHGLVIDLFAGGGGASRGIKGAMGRDPDIAINHNPVALAVHEANHPKTQHLTMNLTKARPAEIVAGRRVYMIWASPDCRDHSPAKGGKPLDRKIRSLPWVVIRWARETLPDILLLENVPTFTGWGPLDENDKRIKARKGEFFRRWLKQLKRYGYSVEYHFRDASDAGVPTSRKRLYLIARRDGKPIFWPKPTHGVGLARKRSSGDCMDWQLQGRSIFGRKKPLAEKTMWRIAQGLRRFIFENPRPYIIRRNQHGQWEPVFAATLQQSGFGERKGQRARTFDLEKPLTTIVADGQKHALIQAFLTRYFGDPLRSDGGGGVVSGGDLQQPLPTVTARDHHALAAVTLVKYRGTHENQPASVSLDEPLPTISSGGGRGGVHIAEVRAFLTAYYGSDGTGGQELFEPLRTITSKARLGLVTVYGVDYQITDITLRMLQPEELLRCQFGKYAADYDLSAAKTKAEKVDMIGNSVCPEEAEALVAANTSDYIAEAA